MGKGPVVGGSQSQGEGRHLSFCGQLLEMEEQSLGNWAGLCCWSLHRSPVLRPAIRHKGFPRPEAQRGRIPHGGLTWLLGAFQPQQHPQGLRGIPGPQGPPDPALRRSEQPRPPRHPDANPWDPRLCDLTGQV